MSDVLITKAESIENQTVPMMIDEEDYRDQKENTEKEPTSMNLEETISVCCNIIDQIVKITEKFKFKSLKPCLYDSQDLPTVISLYDYLKRISTFLKLDTNIITLSMINLDKFLEHNPGFILNKLNTHK